MHVLYVYLILKLNEALRWEALTSLWEALTSLWTTIDDSRSFFLRRWKDSIPTIQSVWRMQLLINASSPSIAQIVVSG